MFCWRNQPSPPCLPRVPMLTKCDSCMEDSFLSYRSFKNLGNSTFILCLEPDPLGRVKSKSRPVLQTGGLFSRTLSEHERCQPYTTVRLPIKCSPYRA